MKKKLALFIAILLLCAPAVTACGNSGDVKGKVTVTVAVIQEQGEVNSMTMLKKAFEQTNSLINIRIVQFPGDYNLAMQTYIRQPDTMPDIVWTGGDKHAAYSSAGNFLDLTDDYNSSPETALSNYYPSMIEATHYSPSDKGIWFAPRDYNKSVVFVNKTMFADAGIDYTQYEDGWTEEQFLQVCQQLRTVMDTNTNMNYQLDGLNKNSYPVDANLTWDSTYLSMMASEGVNMIDPSSDTPDSDAVLVDGADCMNAYQDIYNKLVATKYAIDPASSTSDVFLSSGAAMWFNVRPRLPSAVNADLDVDFLPYPYDYNVAGCGGYAITSHAATVDTKLDGVSYNHADLAWQFIKYIITEPGQTVLEKSGTGIPVLMSLNDPAANPDAPWLSYPDVGLNQQAFIANPDRDINPNVVYRFPSVAAVQLQTYLDQAFTQGTMSTNWNKGYSYVHDQVGTIAGYMRTLIANPE